MDRRYEWELWFKWRATAPYEQFEQSVRELSQAAERLGFEVVDSGSSKLVQQSVAIDHLQSKR